MSRILIVGDSYGEGEWIHKKNTHRGLEKYLLEHGCYVKNLSQSGFSNNDSIDTMCTQKLSEFDYIFWFTTDPLRDYRTKDIDSDGNRLLTIDKNKSIVAYTVEEIKQEIYRTMDLALARANNIASTCTTGVHTIGGCYAPDPKLIEKYNNVHIGCENFNSLLEFDFPEDFRGANIPGRIDDLPGTERIDFSSEVIEYLKGLTEIVWSFNNTYPEYFTEHDNHPNRKAHKILADYLVSRFNLTPYGC